MGSSPVTATTPAPATAAAALRATLRAFFVARAPAAGAPVVVAFSGGPDSCALLWALAELAGELGCTLHAAHFDHGLDPGSSDRARQARALAERVGAGWRLGQAGPDDYPAGESREAAARRLRYRFLEGQRQALGARWVATAHHRDDQAETVLLRIAQGAGAAGLAAIAERAGRVVRPLLPLSRRQLLSALADSPLEPLEDPTNGDLRVPRNRLRRVLLPGLPPGTAERCARLAEAAGAARARIEGLLSPRLQVELAAGPALRLEALRALPSPLLPWTLGLLHRAAGLPHPPRRSALLELARQLRGPHPPGCDCGDGWRWAVEGELLVLRRVPAPCEPFAYTLVVPGEVEVPSARCRLRLSWQPTAPWMWRGSAWRAALRLPLVPGQTVAIRSRRPGDRIQPLGSSHSRRLKELLIDRKVPRRERDRLPLLCLRGQIAWVPGVTIHHPFRLPPDARAAWVVEMVCEDLEPEGV